MILNQNIDVKIYSKNINYYKNIGYTELKNNDIINIDISLLSKGSHILVDVECDICKNVKKLKYFKYIRNISRGGYYSCSIKCGNDKRKLTNIEQYGATTFVQSNIGRQQVEKSIISKYGVDNLFKSELIKNKIKETCYVRYGYDSPMKNVHIINKGLETKKLKGIIFNIKDDDFNRYKRIIRNLTRKHKKKLYDNWSGIDYYDNEYIRDNINLDHNDPLFPTIDHKISLVYGYINKISPYIVGSFDNLCITKRKINSSKNHKIDFILN